MKKPQEETAIVEVPELDLTFDPTLFDPNVEQLKAIAEEVSKIEADPKKMTKETLELVKSTKNKLVKSRTRIQEIGLSLRRPVKQFADDVLAYERELLAILEPEENRMKGLEKAAKEYALIEERKKTLPEFKEKLASIGDGIEADDDELLAMDPNQRDAYYNQRLSDKLEGEKAEADRKRQEEEAKAKEATQEIYTHRVKQVLQMGFVEAGANFVYGDDFVISEEQLRHLEEVPYAQFIDKAREEIRRIEDVKREEAAREAAERQLRSDRRSRLIEIGFTSEGEDLKLERFDKLPIRIDVSALHTLTEDEFDGYCKGYVQIVEEERENAAERERERMRKQAEEQEAADKAEREAQEAKEKGEQAYQDWLATAGYNEETDKVIKEEGKYVLYRRISSFEPEAMTFIPKNEE